MPKDDGTSEGVKSWYSLLRWYRRAAGATSMEESASPTGPAHQAALPSEQVSVVHTLRLLWYTWFKAILPIAYCLQVAK